MTLTARVLEQAVVDDDAMITGYVTAPGLAARLGEPTQRVSRVLARLATRGEAVQRVCFVRQGAPARWHRLYRVTRDARRAASRRGVLMAGPRVEDPATRDEIAAADFRLPAGNNCAIMGCKSDKPAPPASVWIGEADDRRVPKT